MNLLPGLILLLPAAAFVADRHVVTPAAASAPAAVERVEKTGHVAGWHITPDGLVALRLDDPKARPPASTWFVTPANQTSTTRFEDLVVQSVIAMAANDGLVTITFEADKERVGQSLREAIPIVGIAFWPSHDGGAPAPGKK